MAQHWWARLVVGRTPVSDPLQADDRPDARFEGEWRPLVKTRVLVLAGCVGLWAAGVEARLVFLQLVSHENFVARAKAQQLDIVPIEAPRGDVVDRNGQLLGYSVESFELTVNRADVKDPAADAAELCAALGDCAADEQASIAAKLAKPGKWVVIRNERAMSPNAVIGVRELMTRRAEARKPAMIALTPRNWRYYPKLDLAAHVIGFINPAADGGAGVEWRHNRTISGRPGSMLVKVDGHANELFKRVESAPKPGATVELTLDTRIQHVAERELEAGVRAAGANAGAAVVLAAETGEVLALASYPAFNPNVYWSASDDERRNRAVQDTYEPGSTIKIVTASAAINEGILTAGTLVDCSPGILRVPGRSKPIIEDKRHNYGTLTFADVIVKSSNVGAVRAGLQVGADRMLEYLRGFGLGRRIAPDFGGEQTGYVAAGAGLSQSALASMSMGYEVSVTPLQMAAAASVVANGGVLVEPHLIRAVVRDGRREAVEPKVLRRVISPETALTLTAMMEDVVHRGTGKRAALDRFRVAGKTGTAKKVVDGRYSEVDYNVSFVGFVPSRDPAFIILVVVDSPHAVPAYGGTVAAPIFKRIAEAALQYQNVLPSINPVAPILVTGDRRVLAPPAPAVVVPAAISTQGRPVMPDLRGLTLRDALRVTQRLGLAMQPDGDGVVVFQSPAPGEPIDTVDGGFLRLRRDPGGAGGGGR